MNRFLQSAFFAVTLVGVTLVAGSPLWAQASAVPELKLKHVQANLYVLEASLNGAEGPNIIFYITDEGVVLVDDRYEQNHERVLAEIRKITPQPVRYVILTHRHADKIVPVGNPPAVPTVAQANARKNMAESNSTGLPSLIFNNEMDLFLGGKQVRVLYFGGAHTDGDAVIYFPEYKLVAVGDLMAGTDSVSNPLADNLHGGTISRWPATLDEVLKLEIDAVVPGTGIAVTNKAALKAHRDKIAAINQRVRGLLRDGKGKDEISKILIAEFGFKPINFRYIDALLAELKN
jgi:glyoxylase-like metal-dependent hydrolase (beta-lactamase superfamily II)